jgi:hypothetical protein
VWNARQIEKAQFSPKCDVDVVINFIFTAAISVMIMMVVIMIVVVDTILFFITIICGDSNDVTEAFSKQS